MGSSRPDRPRGGRALAVELIGAPGAGKTTLTPAVLDALERAGYRPTTVTAGARPWARTTRAGRLNARLAPPWLEPVLAWRVFTAHRALAAARHLAREPGLAWHLLASQLGRPAAAGGRRRQALRGFLRALGARCVLTRPVSAGRAVVFDEGLLHRVVQLHTSPVERPTERAVRSYLDRVPPPDLVVHVEAPSATCFARVEARGRWPRLADRSPGEVSRFVANAWFATAVTAGEARRRGWPVVVVDNSGDHPGGPADQLRRGIGAALGVATPSGRPAR
jgi:hypothetical protein